MALRQKVVCGLSGGALAALLAGCSVDSLIWGSNGAKVIEATEKLIADLAAGETSDLVCADSTADFGNPSDWSSLSAGEPEKFSGKYWKDQAALNPQWSINLEGLPEGASSGTTFPGDLFFRETGDELCVIDVAWATLSAVE
ncbi:hypothetical protein [Pseudarthrobacter sp. PS3-L1]|uniref:hypothetical protein n=1 Tax=Pseudarthrobacter sp. PS3-L1 TaxID=3046207 RepID=UPI0024B91BC7|nr:hypothetical protein [Pseudarthrobacter sp. PS3-L1]MDJ0319921.1 hypothetical protein [Pseudarthrobacter sp. PS3-L1]